MTRVAAIFLAFTFMLAVAWAAPASAGSFWLRLHGFSGSTTTPVNFGSRTVIGWGGFSTPLAPGATLAGLGSSDFNVNSVSAIVPAGTVGSGTATFTQSNYGITSAGRTWTVSLLTGDQSIALASVYSSGGEVTNMFFGPCGLSTCAAKATLGSTLWLRDGQWNAANAVGYMGMKPVSQYPGTGRMVARSEHPDAANDANGNPRRQHGAKLGMIYWDPDLNELAPVDFVDVWHYSDAPVPTSASLFAYAGGTGGVGFYNGRVEYGPDVITPNAQYGLILRGPTVISGYHFVNMGTAILHSGDSMTVTNTIFESIGTDALQYGGNHILIDGLFGFGWDGNPADHPDFTQWESGGDGTTSFDDIVIKHSIAVQDLTGGLSSCFRMGGETAPGRLTNVKMEQNICYMGASNGADVPSGDHPITRFMTILTDPLVKADGSKIRNVVAVQDGINGAVIDHLVANEISTAGQTGTITGSANVSQTTNSDYDAQSRTTAQLCATYALALPNLICTTHADPCWRNRACVLFMFTPGNTALASGGYKQVDGTFTGALFAACPSQANGAWNDGTVWNCADGTWLAAHPAASFLIVVGWRRRKRAANDNAEAQRAAA